MSFACVVYIHSIYIATLHTAPYRACMGVPLSHTFQKQPANRWYQRLCGCGTHVPRCPTFTAVIRPFLPFLILLLSFLFFCILFFCIFLQQLWKQRQVYHLLLGLFNNIPVVFFFYHHNKTSLITSSV